MRKLSIKVTCVITGNDESEIRRDLEEKIFSYVFNDEDDQVYNPKTIKKILSKVIDSLYKGNQNDNNTIEINNIEFGDEGEITFLN